MKENKNNFWKKKKDKKINLFKMEDFVQIKINQYWNEYYMILKEKEIIILTHKKEIYKKLLLIDCSINEEENEKKTFQINYLKNDEKIKINTRKKKEWLTALKKKLNPLQNQKIKNQKKKILPKASQKKPHKFIKLLLQNNKSYKKFPLNNKIKIRKSLPVHSHNIKMNLWSIFKANFGKLLSKITIPVHYNEPITFLQKSAEIMEYRNLLRLANNAKNRYKRIGLIFSAILFFHSNNINRIKKPFNPLLGETYEFIDKDFKMVLEQVSHHPPIHFLYAECNDFIFNYTFHINPTLHLNGVTATPLAKSYLFLKKTNENFEISLPPAKYKNMVIGKTYIWFYGLLKIVNNKTGDSIEFNFCNKELKNNESYKIKGFIKNKEEKVVYNIKGYWNSYLNIVNVDNTNDYLICEKLKEKVYNYDKMYYFTDFTINLNNLENSMILELPPTDSRLRPDLRAYEFGDIKLAAEEKERLEINQRLRKKYNDKNKIVWKPKWFDYEIKNGRIIRSCYKGDYFDCKRNGNWGRITEDIFN